MDNCEYIFVVYSYCNGNLVMLRAYKSAREAEKFRSECAESGMEITTYHVIGLGVYDG